MSRQAPVRFPQELIGRLLREAPPPEQAQLLGLARDAVLFISASGQRHPFEDFRKRPHAVRPPPADGFADLRERLREAETFFEGLRAGSAAGEEQEAPRVILDALRFIAATGQHSALQDFLEHVESKAPPYVVAAFETWEEAQAWLMSHPRPPEPADVLIANSYHDVVHERETDLRRLPRNRDLERYLAWLRQVDPPVAAHSFSTRAEADSWLRAQHHPARRMWVGIAGELYLAAYYPHIKHRTLFPLVQAGNPEMELSSPLPFP